jgi:hypothetical protein
MKKLIWTMLIAFTLASLPIGGTAFAGQGHGKHALSKAEHKQLKKQKQARKHNKQARAKHGLKRGHKKT